jgi:hypothetical protein
MRGKGFGPQHTGRGAFRVLVHAVCKSTSGGPTNNICLGHEFQNQAPANWTATLHRGGVLRVKTRPTALMSASVGLTNCTSHVSLVSEDPLTL